MTLAIWEGVLSVKQIQNAMVYGAKNYLGIGTLILVQ